ncbi:MAG: hypothetical protein ACJAZQ_002542 [Cognaticolwellia sp.]
MAPFSIRIQLELLTHRKLSSWRFFCLKVILNVGNCWARPLVKPFFKATSRSRATCCDAAESKALSHKKAKDHVTNQFVQVSSENREN